jgi:hypothetical protein
METEIIANEQDLYTTTQEDVNEFLEDNDIRDEDVINIETINCGLKIWYRSKDE